MCRLLPPEIIPYTLWQNGTIQLPQTLASEYLKLLTERNLYEDAKVRDQKVKIVGGITQAHTDKHFAQAFDGSIARAQLALLDPLNELSDVSDQLIKCLSGNELCLVDAPCGAGAASLAFLCCVAELRRKGVLPRQKLTVDFIGGELSQYARDYAERLLNDVRSSLESQAIFVEQSLQEWDVTNEISNTALVHKMNRTRAKKTLIVVANFSGFLMRSGKLKLATPKLNELFRHAAVAAGEDNNTSIWIEPVTKPATSASGLYGQIRKLINEGWKLFAHTASRSDDEKELCSQSKFQHPILPELQPRVSVAVMPIDLANTRDSDAS